MAEPSATRSVVERFVQAFNAGSIEGMTALVSEDVAHDPFHGPRTVGRQDFETALIHRARCYDEAIGDLVVMVAEDGQRAAAEFTLRGTYRETDQGLPAADGQRYSVPAAFFLEVDDGRISRITAYLSQDQFVAALGR